MTTTPIRHRLAPIALLVSIGMLSATAALATTLDSAIGEIASTLAGQMRSAEVRKLAVVQFSDLAGYESALRLFLAEELTMALVVGNPDLFTVVERQQLKKILEEQKLSSSSLFDPESIESLGRILGIDALVTGTIADLGNSVRLNA